MSITRLLHITLNESHEIKSTTVINVKQKIYINIEKKWHATEYPVWY